MPTKQRVLEDIEKIDKVSISINQLKHFVMSVTPEVEPPLYLKKGDVYVSNSGIKPRPHVIIKVCDGFVFSIPLSTTMDELNISKSKSRFLGEGYFSRSISVSTIKNVKEHFIGVYDNPKLLNKAIKLVKQEISLL